MRCAAAASRRGAVSWAGRDGRLARNAGKGAFGRIRWTCAVRCVQSAAVRRLLRVREAAVGSVCTVVTGAVSHQPACRLSGVYDLRWNRSATSAAPPTGVWPVRTRSHLLPSASCAPARLKVRVGSASRTRHACSHRGALSGRVTGMLNAASASAARRACAVSRTFTLPRHTARTRAPIAAALRALRQRRKRPRAAGSGCFSDRARAVRELPLPYQRASRCVWRAAAPRDTRGSR